jgi:hypothetical protein
MTISFVIIPRRMSLISLPTHISAHATILAHEFAGVAGLMSLLGFPPNARLPDQLHNLSLLSEIVDS